MDWILEQIVGGAQELHDLGVEPRRTVRLLDVSAPALVLGSHQRTADLVSGSDRPGVWAGVELATRSSAGGAVWLAPGEQLWVDVVLPADDPLHCDDIRVAARWMGDAWCGALGGATSTWQGDLRARSASAVACFAGVGPGEVTLGGRKLVGISQRRTRDWSRFQCVAYHRWSPEKLLDRLAVTAANPTRSRAVADSSTTASVGAEIAWTLRNSVAVLADLGESPCPVDVVGSWNRCFVDRLIGQLEQAPRT